MRIDLSPIWYQEINLIGAAGPGMEYWPLGTDESASTFEVATDLIQQKLLHPEKLITHSFALSDYRNALLTATHKGHNRAIKVIFDYSKQPPSVVPNVRAARRLQRNVTPVPYTDPRPSQPLTPPDDTLQPPAPMPQLAPPAPPVSPFSTPYAGGQTPDEDWDDKTIVVSKPKFPRHSAPLQPVEPEQPRQFRQPGQFGQVGQVGQIEQAGQVEPDIQQQSLNAQSDQSIVNDDNGNTFVDVTERFAHVHDGSLSTPMSPTPPTPPDDEEETTTIVTSAHPSPISDDSLSDEEGSTNNENEESSFLEASIPSEHEHTNDNTDIQPVEPVESVEPPPAETSESQKTPAEIPFTTSPIAHEDSMEMPPPLVPSQTNETGMAVDFMPPSEENAGGQAAMPSWLAALNAEMPFTATPDNDNGETTNEGQLPVPPAPALERNKKSTRNS